MPLQHTVLIKLKDDVTDAQKKELLDALYSLKAIEGVLDLQAGFNITNRADFDVVLWVSMKDEAALDYYQVHETHVKVRDEIIGPLSANKIATDFIHD